MRRGKLTDTAIVGALRTREAPLGPSKRRAIDIEKSILLLKTEPGDMFFGKVHCLLSRVSEVGAIRSSVVVIGLSEDNDVISAAEGVFEDGGGAEIYIRVVTRGLVGGGTIKVPNTKLGDIGGGLGERLHD